MSEVDDLKSMVQELMAIIERQDKRIKELEATVERLEDANRRLLRWRFGNRTEKSTDPSQLLIPLPGLTSDLEFEAENAGMAPEVVPARIKNPRSKRALWSVLCPNLDIEEIFEDVPESQRFAADGTPLVKMGTEQAEELVYTPGTCHIRRITRQRYGRSDTAEKVLIASPPTKIVPGGSLSNETIVAAVVHHAMDCLPYQRIAEMITRLGAPVGRNLITEACNAFARLAEPLLDAMQEQIQQTNILHIDGSFLFHQDRTRRRRCQRRPLYAITDGQQVVMRWRPDEKHATAADLISGYHGYLLRDEWQGWQSLVDVEVTHVGCHAHARRYFAEVQDHDDDAKQIIAWYQQIYAIEQRANNSGLTGARLYALRRQLRQTHTRPILDRLFGFAEQRRRTRTGPFRRHLTYLIKHREVLTVFLDDGALPPDNNLAERVLRRNAMLRKNRLFYVGKDCGQHIGTLLSLTVSCRELDLNPIDYLMWALPTLLAYRDTDGLGKHPDLRRITPLAYVEHCQARALAV